MVSFFTQFIACLHPSRRQIRGKAASCLRARARARAYNKNLPIGCKADKRCYQYYFIELSYPHCTIIKKCCQPQFSGFSGDFAFFARGKNFLVKEIGNDVFAYSEISSVKLPKTLKVIGQNAFASCEITSIKLPDSLKTIGDYAFTRTTLKSIEIPDTVSEMGDYVFYSSELESVKLSSGLKKLGKNLFDSCDMLTDVTIPDGVTYIADNCFVSCFELSNVKLPSTLKELGEWTFSGCSKLKDITIPDGVTTIGAFCFSDCGISNITVPDSVTNISGNPFDSDMKITWKSTTYEDSYDFMKAFKGQS